MAAEKRFLETPALEEISHPDEAIKVKEYDCLENWNLIWPI